MARRDSRNRVDLSKGGKRDLLKWPQSYRVIAFSTLIESSQCSQAFAGSRLRGTYELIAQGNCCAWYFLGRHPLGDKFVPLRLPFVPPRALAGLLHAVLARAGDSAARFAQCEARALPRIAGRRRSTPFTSLQKHRDARTPSPRAKNTIIASTQAK